MIQPIEILVVEDNLGDARLLRESMAMDDIPVRMTVVEDGVEAMAYLRREGPYSDALRPRLILLDLNLPRMGGLEVLADLKVDPELKRIPVVVLTTSRAENDIHQSYQLNANCYITKPSELEDLVEVVRVLKKFWLAMVKLPD